MKNTGVRLKKVTLSEEPLSLVFQWSNEGFQTVELEGLKPENIATALRFSIIEIEKEIKEGE